MNNEKRRAKRFNFHINVELSSATHRVSASCLNLSQSGILLEVEEQPPVDIGDVCRIALNLGENRIHIAVKAQLVRKEGQQIGFKFEEIDLDSFTHFRRLIEINSGEELFPA